MDNLLYKKLFDELLSMMDEGVHIVDGQGVTIFYNKVMSRIEQLSATDVIGHPYEMDFPSIKREESTIHRALNYGESTRNRPQQYHNLTGNPINTINTTIPVLDENQLVIGAIEVAHDITQLSNLSDKMMQLQSVLNHGLPIEERAIRHYTFTDLSGDAPSFLKTIDRAKRAAKNDASVLIYGETGTGKELFAQSIHYGGVRARKPFLAQNCTALPSNLLEGILFGTAKGGFTGAQDRAGLFEQANGGTLLLDELNSMPYDLQGKLLRVLQESYIRRVGGNKDLPIDVRIIATVNEDPLDMIDQGLLRQDLYYRLCTVSIEIPPLRERKSDIPHLAQVFLAKHSERLGKNINQITRETERVLMDYDYPGNVRELENIIVQALFMTDDELRLEQNLINIPKPRQKGRRHGMDYQAGESLTDYIDRTEEEIICDMFSRCNRNITQCADVLHIKRQTLQHKLKKYNLIG